MSNRQAQSSPSHFPASDFVNAVETFEDPGLIFITDSWTGVADREDHSAWMLIQLEENLSWGGGVLAGIVLGVYASFNDPQNIQFGVDLTDPFTPKFRS